MKTPVIARAAALGAAALLAAGCGSSSHAPSSASPAKSSNASSNSMPGMNMTGTSMSGMSATVNPSTAANLNTKGISVGGIHPIPTQLLTSATWQGMEIQAYATTAVPFDVFDGTQMQEIKPKKSTSFHLMVMLTDASTHVAIPYSTVWATIKSGSKVVYDERQYPMISRYMGPHYGNDVTVPGSGTYTISLLVSPPVSARHVEYQGVWTSPHKTSFTTFHWSPPGT